MPPETTAGAAEPQAGTAAQPQAGTTAGGQEPPPVTGQEPAAGTTQPGTGETAEQRATRLERELGEARKEAAANRTKATTLQREKDAAAQAGMSELERAQAEATALKQANAELERRVKDQALRSATYEAAGKLGFRNPDLAYRLLDPADIELEADGTPKNIEHLLKHLLQREPYLGKAAGADFGGGNRGTAPGTEPGMNELLRAAFRG